MPVVDGETRLFRAVLLLTAALLAIAMCWSAGDGSDFGTQGVKAWTPTNPFYSPFGLYSHPGDGGSCWANDPNSDGSNEDISSRTDPMGIMFHGGNASAGIVEDHIRKHLGWDHGGWSDQRALMYHSDQTYHCDPDNTAVSNNSEACQCSRSHIRLWYVAATPFTSVKCQDYNPQPYGCRGERLTVGTPHFDQWHDWYSPNLCTHEGATDWECVERICGSEITGGSHAVPEGMQIPEKFGANTYGSGFDYVKYQIAWRMGKTPGHHNLAYEPWGNTEPQKQCDGETSASNGQGVIIAVFHKASASASASSVGSTTATLSGSYSPDGEATEWWFGYGQSSSEDAEYPTKTAIKSVAATASEVTATQAVSGLSSGTTYFYRLFVRYPGGEIEPGNESEFKTPVPTQTTVVAHPLNGQPGSLGTIWASGTVTSGGSPFQSSWVNVNFLKLEGGQWVNKDSRAATVTNGSYSTNSEALQVGKGTWKLKAVFQPAGELAQSETMSNEFFIGDGYQLVNRYSGKCLDVANVNKSNGATLQQFDCLGPAQQNQVFSLVQIGSTWQLVARHSNRCVDVTNDSLSNGTILQQWQCLQNVQQKWYWEDVGGGFSRFKGSHSGKCIEVGGPSTANGASVGQWDCGTESWRQWQLKSVESGPMKPDITFHVDQVLHGQPGFVNVSGKINAAAYPLTNQKVNLIFEKETSPGSWSQLNNVENLSVDGEGNFNVDYHGVSSGDWRARAVFNSTTPLLATNSSPNEPFHVKRGYVLVSKYSEKCMAISQAQYNNGQGVLQWTCPGNPTQNDGYLMRFVPVGAGLFNLEFEHSNESVHKCLDVVNAGTQNGAWTQIWGCNTTTAQQIWQKIPIAGETDRYALSPQHAPGKCADVTGPSAENGPRIQIWECHWKYNQRWELRGIG